MNASLINQATLAISRPTEPLPFEIPRPNIFEDVDVQKKTKMQELSSIVNKEYQDLFNDESLA